MSLPSLADATDLAHWADRIAGRYDFPELIRRLILATSEPCRIEFRAQEGAGFAGWDGETESEIKSTFVPAGNVFWELGVGKDPEKKINSDYQKRTSGGDDEIISDSTFIFCTPRRWAGKEKWISDKKKEEKWKDILVYDADNLATWLSIAQGVHVWITAKIGKPVEHVQDLQFWWNEWSQRTNPIITAKFLLSGRQKAVEMLLCSLYDEPSVQIIKSETTAESEAFIAAVIDSSCENDRDELFATSVVVDSPDTFRYFAVQDGRFAIIVPNPSESYPVKTATENGHHVLLAVGSDYPHKTDIDLPRLSASIAYKTLEGEGVPTARARSLAALARRSLMAFRRVTTKIAFDSPEWVSGEHGPQLIPLLLAGKWNETNESDKDAIEYLTGKDYNHVKGLLQKWRKVQDAPFRQIGTEWHICAKEDSWRMLAEFCTREDIENFIQVVKNVLLEQDPKRELPFEERPYASMKHISRKYSEVLREGISDSLAMLGALSSGEKPIAIASGHDIAWQIDSAIKDLTNEAITSKELWIDLSGHLMNLAEASPDQFLAALEHDLKSSIPSILTLWDEQSGLMMSNYGYPSLLWALEHLAWSSEYFTRVVLVLGKLVAIVPDTKLSNSPFRSLLSFFRIGFSQCGASLQQRKAALIRLRGKNHEVARKLFLALLPDGHGFSIRSGPGARSILWRDWPSEPQKITRREYWDSVKEVSDLIVSELKQDYSSWIDIIKHILNLHPESFDKALAILENLPATLPENSFRFELWNELRDLVNDHRAFSDAKWALPADVLDRISDIVKRLTPTSLSEKYKWIFSNNPKMGNKHSDWKEKQEKLKKMRNDAVKEILMDGGIESLIAFSEIVDAPFVIGGCLFEVDHDDEISGIMVQELGNQGAQRMMAQSFIRRAIWDLGDDWVDKFVNFEMLNKLDHDSRVSALLCFPVSESTLDYISSFDEVTQSKYWKSQNQTWTDDGQLFDRMIQELIKYKRPRFALDILAMHTHGKKDMLNSSTVYKSMYDSLIVSPDEDITRVSPYDAKQLLDFLTDDNRISRQEILTLEWHYLPILSIHAGRLLLHEELENNPEFFVEIIGYEYKRDDNDDTIEYDEQKSRCAWHLLESWNSVPGMKADGTLDGEFLKNWIIRAIQILKKEKLITGGYVEIGRMLRWGPQEKDGIWPDPGICEIVEELADEIIDRHFDLEIYNSRGTTSRGPYDGGQQERDLADRYEKYATNLQANWPRVSSILKNVAKGYRSEAKGNDQEAERREDNLA